MRQNILSQAIFFALGSVLLTGCGGSGSGAGTGGDLTLAGAVIDGPVAGAKVCLYANGQPVKNGNTEVCSGNTDANGNYTLTIPAGLVDDAKRLTLVATKGTDVKLVSFLGTVKEVKAKSKSGKVTDTDLPHLKVSHFTTVRFALLDDDGNDDVDDAENQQGKAYQDYDKVRNLMALVKAVVDYDKGKSLLTNVAKDTLALVRQHKKTYNKTNVKNLLETSLGQDKNSFDTDLEDDHKDAGFLQTYVSGAIFVHKYKDAPGTLVAHLKDDGTAMWYRKIWPNGLNGWPETRKFTGSWRVKDAKTVTVTDKGVEWDYQYTKIDGNTVFVIQPGDPPTSTSAYYRAQPFKTEEISGKEFCSQSSSVKVTLNSDGTGLEKPVSCDPNGAAFTWRVDEDGVVVLDESKSCTGDVIHAFKLLESSSPPGWFVGFYREQGSTVRYVSYDLMATNCP